MNRREMLGHAKDVCIGLLLCFGIKSKVEVKPKELVGWDTPDAKFLEAYANCLQWNKDHGDELIQQVTIDRIRSIAEDLKMPPVQAFNRVKEDGKVAYADFWVNAKVEGRRKTIGPVQCWASNGTVEAVHRAKGKTDKYLLGRDGMFYPKDDFLKQQKAKVWWAKA